MDDDVYALTEEGSEIVLRIDELFRTTDYDLERIAFEVGLRDKVDVQLMYAIGAHSGLIDAANQFSPED